MTILTETSTVTIQGNNATTIFSFPFSIDSQNNLIVTYTDSLGTSTVLNPSLYTVTLNAIPFAGLWHIGGSVTYPNTGSPPVPIAVGTFLTITRDIPYEQTVSISNQGAFYPQAVEQGLDLLELQIQQLNTDFQYTMKFPVTDVTPPNTLPPAAARANSALIFDSNGQPTVQAIPSFIPTPGQFANPRRVSVTGTSTVNILLSDSFAGVSINQSSTPVTTIQLPSTEGPYPVFDGSGNAASFPITILPPAGKTINGLNQYIMAFNYQAVTFYWDGTQYLAQ